MATGKTARYMEAKATWSVLVIHQDREARQGAVKFCDHLIEKFWSRSEFDVDWLSYDLLENPRFAKACGQIRVGAGAT